METLTIHDPLDMHVHFREGDMLKLVAPYTAQHFAAGLIMPNTKHPICSAAAVREYRLSILEACRGHTFMPYMTLYFQTSYTREFLEEVKPHILSIKLYPKGMTTNSDHGVDPHDPQVEKVLGYMEEVGIPLCVHGEAVGYWMDRERLFHKHYTDWAIQFPKLKIIMEHITCHSTVFLLQEYENLYATITPHHLLFTTDDFCGDLLRPHLFCKPLMKRPEDRAGLRDIVLSIGGGVHLLGLAQKKIMLGTDSAPHDEHKKVCDCGCAGVFNGPIALQLLADLFYRYSDLERFQAFVSDNAKRIYGVEPPAKTVTLSRTPYVIPEKYGNVVPMWAGKEIPWTVSQVA